MPKINQVVNAIFFSFSDTRRYCIVLVCAPSASVSVINSPTTRVHPVSVRRDKVNDMLLASLILLTVLDLN